VIPTRTVILLSGIPATGKTEFAKYLARKHGYAHYDLECHPAGWPHPDLHPIFLQSRSAFVLELKKLHARVALDWGFPPSCISWVDELQSSGVLLIWFDGDIPAARKSFQQRGSSKGDVRNFDVQVDAIKAARLPGVLNCLVVPSLDSNGKFLDQTHIEQIVF
jgi:hypothetical protein